MSGKKIGRVILDVVLTAMIVAEMFIQYTGVFLHEVIGFAFFATVVTHLILSAKWIKNTASNAKQGKMTGRRTALAVMGILLAINMVVLGVSSIAISTILEGAGFVWALGSYATWTAVHAVSSYTLCALVTVHLGMHWAFLASAFRVPYDPSRRRAINTGVHAVAAMGALALGVMAVNQIAPIASISGNSADSGTGNGTTARSRNGHPFGSVNDVPDEPGSPSNSGSSSGPSASSESAQNAKERNQTKGNASNPSNSVSVPDQDNAPKQDYSSAPDQNDHESVYGEEPSPDHPGNDSSTVTGICTLCRKQCPLSAPRCDRPYREGLL